MNMNDSVFIEYNPSNMKPWWESKTIWVNLAAAFLVSVEAFTGVLQPILPIPLYETIAAVLPLANSILRMITTKPIA